MRSIISTCRNLARRTTFAALGVGLLLSATVSAVTLGEGSLGFAVRAWQAEQGLPQNTVNAIVQTRDGYLWLGTQNGLVRFDGVGFKVFGLRQGLQSVDVRALLEDRDGALWVGTSGGGVSRGRDGHFTTFTQRDGLAGNIVTSLAQDGEGSLWIGTTMGLSQWRAGRFSSFTEKEGPPGLGVRGLYTDRGGHLWITTGQDGLFQFQQGKLVEVPIAFPNPSQKTVYSLLEDRKGRLWIGVGNGVLLCREGGVWRRYDATQGLPSTYLTTLLEAGDGTLWAGSLDEGLFYRKGSQFLHLSQHDGLSDNAVRSLLEDREGDLWVGTRAGGLNRVAPRKLATLAAPQGLTNEFVRSIAESPDGTLWAATTGGGLYRYQGGTFTAFVPGSTSEEYRFVESVVATRDGTLWWGGSQGLFSLTDQNILGIYLGGSVSWLRGDSILSMREDREKGLWVGTARGQLRRLLDGQFTTPATGLPADPLVAMAQSADGTFWIGTGGSGVLALKGSQVSTFTTRQGLGSDFIRALFVDHEGTLWIGTAGGGLSRWRDGHIVNFTTKEGLVDDTVSQVLEDDAGNLWLGCNRGICRLSKRELNELAERKISFVHPLVFGKSEGMLAEECSSGSSPACFKSKSGLLCFATVKGVVLVDPKRQQVNERPPAVLLEEVVFNGEAWEPREMLPAAGKGAARAAVMIPPGGRNIEFHYTGLSFTAPDKVRFRFQLVGLDSDWVEAGTRRVAYYPHVPHGHYTFRVIACNSDGVWNKTGAVLDVLMRPYFYQTWWFLGAATAAAAAGLALVVRDASQRKLRRQLQMLEMQHAVDQERTRIAKDIHDDLGASLTQITLLSELGKSAVGQPEQAEQHFAKIGGKSRLVVQSLDEIVWAVNPKNDNLVRLVEYLCRFADECFESTDIRCWQEVPEGLPNLPVHAEVRHNFFLAVKEAFNNVLKHAGATEVWLRIAFAEQTLRLEIEDNGSGFTREEADVSRSGLKNMKTRIEEIGGQMELETGPQRGTRVRFSIRLEAAAPTGPGKPRFKR